MSFLQTKCTEGRNLVGTARDCLNVMGSGSLKISLTGSLESLGGALNTELDTINNGEKAVDLQVLPSLCQARSFRPCSFTRIHAIMEKIF